jgi:hypothetical protein
MASAEVIKLIYFELESRSLQYCRDICRLH